jgi:hypothetical protein
LFFTLPSSTNHSYDEGYSDVEYLILLIIIPLIRLRINIPI